MRMTSLPKQIHCGVTCSWEQAFVRQQIEKDEFWTRALQNAKVCEYSVALLHADCDYCTIIQSSAQALKSFLFLTSPQAKHKIGSQSTNWLLPTMLNYMSKRRKKFALKCYISKTACLADSKVDWGGGGHLLSAPESSTTLSASPLVVMLQGIRLPRS